MRELIACFDWTERDAIVLRNRWTLLGPPTEVRNVLREYLTVAAKCKLTSRPDRVGLKVTYVCQTSETGINIRILLAALRRLYDHLIAFEGYGHPNPLLQEDMARVAKKSRFYLSRQFEKARGISPGRYLARLRLEEAKKLLVNSKLVLKEIAALCGFGDSNYLCKVFRKTHGVSPGVYRAARNAEARRSGSRLGDARMRPEAR